MIEYKVLYEAPTKDGKWDWTEEHFNDLEKAKAFAKNKILKDKVATQIRKQEYELNDINVKEYIGDEEIIMENYIDDYKKILDIDVEADMKEKIKVWILEGKTNEEIKKLVAEDSVTELKKYYTQLKKSYNATEKIQNLFEDVEFGEDITNPLTADVNFPQEKEIYIKVQELDEISIKCVDICEQIKAIIEDISDKVEDKLKKLT